MNITLDTNNAVKQLVQNVEDLFRSIEQHYYVPHIERQVCTNVAIDFGRHPIKENRIEFSPHTTGKPRAFLRIGDIDDALCQKLTGLSKKELAQKKHQCRETKGNYAANQFDKTLQPELDERYGEEVVTLCVDDLSGSYSFAKVSAVINIEMLTDPVIKSVSEFLKHSGLPPRATEARNYSL